MAFDFADKGVRIGIYAIALNEEKFAERWARSAADADYRFVGDTGSTDKTFSLLLANDIKVRRIRVKPFRFDDARNAVLAMLPPCDIVIALDLDEELVEGWRDIVLKHWTPGATRMHYNYQWSDDVSYRGEKITGRFTHRWIHPVHEIMKATVPEVYCECPELLITHAPDPKKSRGQYLPLLELAVQENADDDRNSHYLGREYHFHARYVEAINELTRHLSLPRATWKAERCASMRYIAKSHEALNDFGSAYGWYLRAIAEDPTSREALIDAAGFQLRQNKFFAVIDLCERVETLPLNSSYLTERYASQEGLYDLASVAHFRLGQKERAIQLAKTAKKLNPKDQRLIDNLRMMQAS